ncbi:MAG: glyoxylase-like metal-dependent hydrolase (beta-lactamase superfamily II) [Verrucomicrobiales bacterium]|jgi:glyoxylase-like metal-dependent hydrolase (beta-lactamase superfamily II)
MEVHTIDHQFGGKPHCIASFLVESGRELALIESGPSSTLENVLDGIRKAGFDPAEVKKVLVTHVHLDHAGAAGWWASQGAQVYVHPSGAKHLVDPSRLIEGARMVYGDRLETLWGEILPIPKEQVTALADCESIKIGNATITAWDTPGHAYHHHAFVLDDGVVFAGDVAGVRLPGQKFISPTTAPSQFNPEPYIKSIRRLREAQFDWLTLTHYGSHSDADDHLARYEEIVTEVAELIGNRLKAGETGQQLLDAFANWNNARAEADGANALTLAQYENANPTPMCVEGVELFWKKQLAAKD